jgi:3-oxoacyl-[acyl-carrier protein] reductase
MGGSLDGMVALVTGSGRGMGRSHAVLMASRGADIIVHDINPENAAETAEQVRDLGRSANVIIADVRDTKSFCSKILEAEESHGKIDILVNNAGVSGNKLSVEDIDEEIYDALFDIQVRGAFFALRAVLPGMKSRKYGKIINISSIYAMGGSSFASHYAAAKSALSGFTKSWAREFAPWNICCNAVAPGFILTDMTRGSNTVSMLESRSKSMPLGRFTEPVEISYAVAWLASKECDMVTGQVISPNSGEVIVGY